MQTILSLLVMAVFVAGTRIHCRKPADLSRVGCGFQKPCNNKRLKYGTIPNIAEHPWTALLFYGDEDLSSPKCNGVLISRVSVVTVAHCLIEDRRKNNLTFVRLGEYDLNSNPDIVIRKESNTKECFYSQVDIKPRRITIHPEYESSTANRHHDIGLILLEHGVFLTEFIQPICLPGISFDATAKRNFTVSGWGLTDRFREQGYPNIFSPVKLKEDLPLFDWEACKDVYRSQISLGSGQLCAGGELDKDTCQGDSGSPLMTFLADDDKCREPYWVLVGLVSLGPQKCGTEGKPGIYTNVKEYVDWIKANAYDLENMYRYTG